MLSSLFCGLIVSLLLLLSRRSCAESMDLFDFVVVVVVVVTLLLLLSVSFAFMDRVNGSVDCLDVAATVLSGH